MFSISVINVIYFTAVIRFLEYIEWIKMFKKFMLRTLFLTVLYLLKNVSRIIVINSKIDSTLV